MMQCYGVAILFCEVSMARRRQQSKGGGPNLIVVAAVVGVPAYAYNRIMAGDQMVTAIVAGVAGTIIGSYVLVKLAKWNGRRRVRKMVYRVAYEHQEALGRIYRRKVYKGDYGETRYEAFDKELKYFYQNIIRKELDLPKRILDSEDFYSTVEDAVYEAAETAEEGVISIEDVPTDPYEFERWTATILNQHGWTAQSTKGSGDQGSDVIAERDGHRCVIQCKLYRSPVGNKAVQEVDAAKRYFDGHSAVVVGKSGYTRAAKQLAEKNSVLLIDASELPKLAEALSLA
jgi:restriction system protein